MGEETKAHTGPKFYKWWQQRQGMTHVSLVAQTLLVTLQLPRILSFLTLPLWSKLPLSLQGGHILSGSLMPESYDH